MAPSYPSNVSVVVVTGYWSTPDGPCTGIVTFTPNAVLQDGSSTPPTILLPKPISAVLVNGAITVQLMATDSASLSPAGWVYAVTESITGQPNRTYSIQLPAAVSPVDLTTAAKVTTPPAQTAYVQASAVGAPSGVASLDSSGHVPASQLVNAPGGTPSSTVVSETGYGQPATAGTTSTYSRGDHTHGSPSLASTAASASAVGDSATVGTATAPARADHVHGREAFGTVTAQTSFGAAAADGTAATVARSDHTHGTPAVPTLAGLGGVPTTRTIGTTAPLTGGGDLSADRTLSVADATALAKGVVQLAGDLGGTAAAPTVPGLAAKVPTSRQITTGTGLTGGGDLTADRTLSVSYGTTAGTAAQGNDSRITGSLQSANNLSDVGNTTTARSNLGLGGAATLNVGTTTGTVAAGDDSRITGAVQASTVTTKGDLIVGTGNAAITRLPAGSDRRVATADSSQTAGIRWVDPLGLECVLTNINGMLATGSNAWPTANDARYVRVLGSGTISKIALEVMVQSGNISVAVYSKTGSGLTAKPGSRVATSGTIACPAVGYVEISLGASIAVSDGDYLALSCDNTTAAFRGLSGGVNNLAAPISYAQATAHPLPATATPVASASRIPTLIGVP